jgi:L-alanine-DL-glutamate epimerase-like enolase superfamily enzyme
VRRLLDPRARDQIPCYASVLWPERPEQVATSAAEFVRQGYQAIKYGWAPMGPDLELDVELVAAAREALGPKTELMVDAGRAWTVDQARLRLERFSPYGLTWREEPLPPADLEGYRQLAEARTIPIAAGEAICLLEEYESLLRQGRIQVIQPDLGRVGGITWARRIAAVAEEVSAWPVPHAYGTGVMLAASAQWTAAGQRPLTEFTRAPSPLARDLVRTDLTFEDGGLRLGNAPGLGVEIDPEVAARYRVA